MLQTQADVNVLEDNIILFNEIQQQGAQELLHL